MKREGGRVYLDPRTYQATLAEHLAREFMAILRRYGLDCSRYAPPHLPSLDCHGSMDGWRVQVHVLIHVEGGGEG